MKKFSKLSRGILLFSIFLMPTAKAINCNELEQLWRGQHLREFNFQWDTRRFSCEGLNAHLALSLFDLQRTQYTPNSSGYWPNFYELVRQNVRAFKLDEGCGKKTIAHTTGREVSFCPRFFTQTRVDRNSTVVHETRHTQDGDPGHVTCSHGSQRGRDGACDTDFHNGSWNGSGYNADIYYLQWSISSSNNDALARDVMQGSINELIPDRFNQITSEQTNQWRR